MNKFITLLAMLFLGSLCGKAESKARVFVFTDINIDSGDPDDRQSLIHLFWYANELQIEGIVPDRWNAMGLEACELVLDAYAKDYEAYDFQKRNYPAPANLNDLIAKDIDQAFQLFSTAASDTNSPLYVLIWGNMKVFKSILFKNPELSGNIRLITIGTGLMLEKDIPYMPPSWEKSAPCKQLNWNGAGRKDIYQDPQFNDMWWLEINWTYAGMFSGEEPKEMFEKLSRFGNMGKHIKEVVKNESWAQYFRVGDTPSALYLIDPDHNPDDPTQSSWAGKFFQPFPSQRPHYYTDFSGLTEWNYADPCTTWDNHLQVQKTALTTLLDRRAEMYTALLDKLASLYKS